MVRHVQQQRDRHVQQQRESSLQRLTVTGACPYSCREAWYLEIGSGHHWLARRVPDGTFFVTGNQGRFKASRLLAGTPGFGRKQWLVVTFGKGFGYALLCPPELELCQMCVSAA